MWYLYLNESGDLGFDFANKKPSNFFTVTTLVVKGMENNRALIKAVKKTIDRKLNPFKKRHGIVSELKGYGTLIEVKKYFYKQLLKVPFEIFCVTLNKRQLDIHHRSSNQELGLQAADMFSWGVFRKYESADKEWFELFKDRIRCDIEYPPK